MPGILMLGYSHRVGEEMQNKRCFGDFCQLHKWLRERNVLSVTEIFLNVQLNSFFTRYYSHIGCNSKGCGIVSHLPLSHSLTPQK